MAAIRGLCAARAGKQSDEGTGGKKEQGGPRVMGLKHDPKLRGRKKQARAIDASEWLAIGLDRKRRKAAYRALTVARSTWESNIRQHAATRAARPSDPRDSKTTRRLDAFR